MKWCLILKMSSRPIHSFCGYDNVLAGSLHGGETVCGNRCWLILSIITVMLCYTLLLLLLCILLLQLRLVVLFVVLLLQVGICSYRQFASRTVPGLISVNIIGVISKTIAQSLITVRFSAYQYQLLLNPLFRCASISRLCPCE